MLDNHEDQDHSHLMSDIAPMALFVVVANLAKKLKVTPKEFGDMLNDLEGAHVYLEDLMLSKIKEKIEERRKGKK